MGPGIYGPWVLQTEPQEPEPTRFPGFSAELGLIYASDIDEDSVMIYPDSYCHEPDDSEDANWRDTYEACRCWKTTVVYEQIGEDHPHIVRYGSPLLKHFVLQLTRANRYKRRDPWTALPVVAKPSGPPLVDFINQHRAAMYSAPLDGPSSRILQFHRPLVYQWALHIISGLIFVHSHDIIFGEHGLDQCWLSSSLDLSLVGFKNAGFRYRKGDYSLIEGDHSTSGFDFTPRESIRNPTKETDLFWFGCTVFHLMTGAWPGDRLENRSGRQAADLAMHGQWRPLESECMGEIVHKCWSGGYNSPEEVQTAIIKFLQDNGWDVEQDDKLQGFVATDLFL